MKQWKRYCPLCLANAARFSCCSPEAAQMLEVRAVVRHKKLTQTQSWRDMLFHLSTGISSRRNRKRMGKWGDILVLGSPKTKLEKSPVCLTPESWVVFWFSDIWKLPFYSLTSAEERWWVKARKWRESYHLEELFLLKGSAFHHKDQHTVLSFSSCKAITRCRWQQRKTPEISCYHPSWDGWSFPFNSLPGWGGGCYSREVKIL